MATTDHNILAPSLKIKCHFAGILVFLLALFLLNGGGICSSETQSGLSDSSLTTTGIETGGFTNGFGAQPRLFEPHPREGTVVLDSKDTTTTTTRTPNISPTHSTFQDSILKTQLNHDTPHLKVTNEHASSNYFLSTSLSDSEISSPIIQTDILPVNAIISPYGTSSSSPSTEITIKPDTSQSMELRVHSSPVLSEPDNSQQTNSIHISPTVVTSLSSTPTLVGTPVQTHSEGLNRMYDDEVIVALPGVDSERNVIARVDQAHEYVSIGVNVIETSNLTTTVSSVMDATAPALVMTSPPDSAPDQQEPSSESQVRKEESHIQAGTIAGIVVASIGFAAIVAAALGFAVFRRLHILRNKSYDNKFSSDTCSYLDSLQVSYINSHIDIPKESNDEMFSLDNDSFLNSLEAMTMENYWAEDSRNTKV